jgi:hypothetical protein
VQTALEEKSAVIDSAARDRHSRVMTSVGAGLTRPASMRRSRRCCARTRSQGTSAAAEVTAQTASEVRHPAYCAIGAAKAAGTAVLTPTMQA